MFSFAIGTAVARVVSSCQASKKGARQLILILSRGKLWEFGASSVIMTVRNSQ